VGHLCTPLEEINNLFVDFCYRDALDATVVYREHSKFVEKWLKKLEEEDEVAASVPKPTPTATAEEPPTIEKCARG